MSLSYIVDGGTTDYVWCSWIHRKYTEHGDTMVLADVRRRDDQYDRDPDLPEEYESV